MAEMRVSIDLSGVQGLSVIAEAGVYGNLAVAVGRVAQEGVERWRRLVQVAPLWSGEIAAYAATVRAHQVGAYAWEILSDYKYVEDIENGRPAYDLKRMLDTSPKVRTTKKGQRYLIIPMRHNTPGQTALAPAMSAEIYAEAKELAPSRIVGHGIRRSGLNATDVNTRRPMEVRARRYLWGGRLPAGLAPKLKEHHTSDPYAGMVRMDARTPGGKRYSTYLTFRIMGEWQSGKWILPAKSGLHLAQAVADSLQRSAAVEFPRAIQADIDAA